MRIGVDVGGTNIKAALVSEGEVLKHVTSPTNASAGPAAVLDTLARTVAMLEEKPDTVGVAIPGEVDYAGNCYRLPNIPGFEKYPLRNDLSRRLGCPVVIENDGTASALAEQLFGWGAQYGSFLLVTLGTGIGGGLVLDGSLRRGRNGFAGEIGHVLVDTAPDAWPCGCGRTGCMEAYAGIRGLLRKDRELGGKATEVREIFKAGNENAAGVAELLGWALGAGLASLNNALDLDAIVFTGGVANNFARFEPVLRAAFRVRSFSSPQAEIPMVLSRLGEHAGVIGAAWLPAAGKSRSTDRVDKG
jgi:glucokinase